MSLSCSKTNGGSPSKLWYIPTLGGGLLVGGTLVVFVFCVTQRQWLASRINVFEKMPPWMPWVIGGSFAVSGLTLLDYGVFRLNKTPYREERQLQVGQLTHILADLKREIESAPEYQEELMKTEDYSKPGIIPSLSYASLFTHVHQILPHVFVGDYRAYLSVDPQFLKKHSMVDPTESIFEGKPSSQQQKWMNKHLDHKGCVDKKIKSVISVTQFKARDGVPDDDWSKFEPDLENLGIKRMQIDADDDEEFWEHIQPYLEEIFKQIDHALISRENVLIHCMKGAVRSTTVVYAYLINRCRGIKVEQAHNFVCSKRHQAELKPSIRKNLDDYKDSLAL